MTLIQHFALCEEQLYDGKLILNYFDKEKKYELIYDEPVFRLIIKNATKTDKYQNCHLFNSTDRDENGVNKRRKLGIDNILKSINEEGNYQEERRELNFRNIKDFWTFFNEEKIWYNNYIPEFPKTLKWDQDNLLAKFVIEAVNLARKTKELETNEHRRLLVWETRVRSPKIDKSEFKFFCPNCKTSLVQHLTLYPEPLCMECCKLVTDENGEKVTFGHGNNQTIQGWYPNRKSSYDKSICYINSKEFKVGQDRWGFPIIYYKCLIPY
jgi:hypothetical protein